jgi:hypothetical protein
MSINKKDSEKIITLAKEGKRISKIMEENFPEYEYWEIYSEVYGDGGQSALGVKRMIANRLNQLCEANKKERTQIIDELNDLIWFLYDNHKSNQKKLDTIRKALS